MATNATLTTKSGKVHQVNLFQCGRGYWRCENEQGKCLANVHGKRETVKRAIEELESPFYNPSARQHRD